jgi:hypothetical protein
MVAGRTERETSPRILERLLEESQEPSPSSSVGESQLHGRHSDSLHARSRSHHQHSSGSRHRHGSDDSASNAIPSGAFLQNAARELKMHFKSLGPQTSLDIAGQLTSVYNERYANPSARGNMQGTFRPREEAGVNCDIDNATSTVNR